MKPDLPLSRREFLRKTGALGVNFTLASSVLGMGQKQKPVESKPNFVFVMTDDQTFDAFSLYDRYPFLKTPNLDAFAKKGAIFDDAFVTISLCSPSRASIMTGTHAHVHNVRINEESDPDPSLPSLAGVLRENGYETAFIGKWHMATHSEPRAGYDYWLSFKGQGEYFDPLLNENGKNFRVKGHTTDILTDYAIKWMDQPREKPFCLFLWHKAIHMPFTPPPRHKDLYAGERIKEGVSWNDDFEGKPAWIRRGITYGFKAKEWNASEGKPIPDKVELRDFGQFNEKFMNYLRLISAVDESMGKLEQYFQQKQMLDNTVLIYTSDNGYNIGTHQEPVDKRIMYEESIRIPLFIRYPKLIKPGSKIKGMALNIDIAPTILDLADAPIPNSMQGRSLVPLFKGKPKDWRKSFLYEYFQEKDFAPGVVTMVGVRTERYKYIHYPELKDDIDELYDLKKDPIEMKNLINNPKYADVLKDMKTELDRLIKKTGYN